MNEWQRIVLIGFILYGMAAFERGWRESKSNKNPFGLARIYTPLGIFVWGDAVVFGPFWAGAAALSYVMNDWYLFLLIISVFWLVRSLGETIYWLNQQFSKIERNPPATLIGYAIFDNDSIWYVYQIVWQCVLVISTIATIYMAKLWFGV